MKDILYAFTVFFGMLGVLGIGFVFFILFAFIVIQLRDFIVTKPKGRKGGR